MEKCFLLCFLTLCAFWDLRRGKIPNRLIFLGMVCFCITGLAGGDSADGGGMEWSSLLLSFVLRSLFTVGVLFPLFLFRMMGAGDIKVMAVTAGYLGLGKGFEVIFYGLAAAAAYSLFYMLKRHILVTRIKYFLNYVRYLFQTEQLLPYYGGENRDGAGFCFIPFLWIGFCLWLAVCGGGI